MIELCDRITDIQRRTFRRIVQTSSAPPPTAAALATSEPILSDDNFQAEARSGGHLLYPQQGPHGAGDQGGG